MSVSVEGTIDLATDSAVFGAFPLFAGATQRPAPVPDFGQAELSGCLFGRHLLDRDVQRLKRVHRGVTEIRAGKIQVGSFTLRYTDLA